MLHEAQLAVLCVAQLAPVLPVPFAHVHSFKAHWRSDVVVFATDSYCELEQSVTELQVPQPLWSREYATDRYWLPVHVLTALHTRFCVADGATVWHVTPIEHTACAVHVVSRCCVDV